MAQIRVHIWDTIQEAYVDDNFYALDTTLLESGIIGLPSTQTAHAEYIPEPIPSYDSRGWNLVITNIRLETAHPVYSKVKTYQITYSLSRKTNAEIIKAITDAEADANNQIMPFADQSKKLNKQNRLMRKKLNNQKLNSNEEAFMAGMDELQEKFELNEANAEAKIAYTEAHATLVPDFNTGWTIE